MEEEASNSFVHLFYYVTTVLISKQGNLFFFFMFSVFPFLIQTSKNSCVMFWFICRHEYTQMHAYVSSFEWAWGYKFLWEKCLVRRPSSLSWPYIHRRSNPPVFSGSVALFWHCLALVLPFLEDVIGTWEMWRPRVRFLHGRMKLTPGE